MLTRKSRADRRFIKKNKLLALAVITYTGAVFILGVLFYRNGELQKYQSFLLPFTKDFRQRPIKRLLNQFRTSVPLVFDINHNDTIKLTKKQKEATKLDELFSTEEDWVNSKISYGDQKLKAKIRLKGQFKDHWREDGLWSYKVKIKGDKTLFGMDRFAVQHPRTRSFINEWVYHKILKKNGIISLRYLFVPLIINGEKLPAFAVEENFSTRMLENNQRREGPIFRLQIRVGPEERFIKTISFYQLKKFNSSSSGRDLIRRAERLITAFMNGELTASEVFDIKLMARTYAISDLFGDDHPILATNMRYYLNPISGLIEPLPYDQQNIIDASKRGLVGERFMHNSPNKIISKNLISMMFNDKKFNTEYGKALKVFSQKDYLNNFFSEINEELEKQIAILQKDYALYEFKQKNILYSNQEYINSLLRPRKPIEAYITEFNKSNNSIQLQLTNMHTLPIDINKILISGNREVKFVNQPQRITNRYKICDGSLCNEQIAPIKKYQNVEIKLGPGDSLSNIKQVRIVGNVVGSDFLFSVPAYSPDEYYEAVPSIKELENTPYLKVDKTNGLISLIPESISLSNSLIIPKEYTFQVKKGSQVDLINGSFILSYSPIKLLGTKDEPILITSSDNTGEGLLVVNVDSKSVVNNVLFEKQNTISKLGLNVTGSITFFNSDVDINNCVFSSLFAEDGLNIVSSKFSINNSTFKKIQSDAIDIDFSNGNINNMKFLEIGNDALDFSGSDINARNLEINIVGDKGISIGEKSTVNIKKASINSSLIGIAVKDDSKLVGKDINVSNSTVGIAGYNKKDWFSGGNINLLNTNAIKNIDDFLNESGSIMRINNLPINPNINNFYKNFYSIP